MTWTAAIALLGSFSVYLLPLVLPHGVLPWGAALVGEITGLSDRSVLWITADLGLAVIVQGAAGLLLYWFFRRPGWRRVAALVPAVPVLFVAVEWLYLIVIPTHF